MNADSTHPMQVWLRMVLAAALLAWQPASAQVAVTTAQYDLGRTGANLQEKVLQPGNVSPAQFGLLFRRVVDDSVYGLPLIVPNVALNGAGQRNLLVVATMNNTVYVFDADDPARPSPYWYRNLGTAMPSDAWTGPNRWGILSTPVIDQQTATIYVVAKVQNGSDIGIYVHALDLATGKSKYRSPQRLTYPFQGGPVLSNSREAIQRAGLLLANGNLYIASANVIPDGQYYSQEGFLHTLRASDLSQVVSTFQATPSGQKGGIWQAGRGLTADASGNVYLATAGGDYDGVSNFGSSILKFDSRGRLMDWFTPSNHEQLFHGNIDPSANGVTLIPGTNLAFAGGKEGIIYLLDRANLGKLETTVSGPLQRFQASVGCGLTDCGQTLGTAFWSRGAEGALYVWDSRDVLRAYSFQANRFNPGAVAMAPSLGVRTSGPSVSANGSDLASGVVWAVTSNVDYPGTTSDGTLRAFRAANVGEQLYSSDVQPQRDGLGLYTKFAPPVVANGKVFVPTQSGSVGVYGLLCGQDVTTSLKVVRSSYRYTSSRSRVSQQITFTNMTNDAIGGPFDLVIGNLPNSVTLTGATGSTSCVAPAGQPYVRAASAPLWLLPGAAFNVTLEFSAPVNTNFTYDLRVVSGSGSR